MRSIHLRGLVAGLAATVLLSTAWVGHNSSPGHHHQRGVVQSSSVRSVDGLVTRDFFRLPLASSASAPASVSSSPTPQTTTASPQPTVRHDTPVPATPDAGVDTAWVSDPRGFAKTLVSPGQFVCLDNLWTHESHWQWNARNPKSGAYGIPQALPGSKMASAGADWRTNPETQVSWGLEYITERYGTPCGAWAHWQRHKSY